MTPPLKQAKKSSGTKDAPLSSELATAELKNLALDKGQKSAEQGLEPAIDQETNQPLSSDSPDASDVSNSEEDKRDSNGADATVLSPSVPVSKPLPDEALTAKMMRRNVALDDEVDARDAVPSLSKPSEAETSSAIEEAKTPGIPAEFDPAVIEASLASLGVKPVSLQGASNGSDADEEKDRSAQSAPFDDGPLALEWASLVDSGFTDPRARGEPLPSHMDPIIRTLLRQALSDQASWRDRVILVTSPTERVSKTTAAINFAFGLSSVGNHKAVLVDVDVTGAGAVGRLGGFNRVGITEALADEAVDVEDLVIETGLDHLTLVASGRPDDAIIDHFGSQRMPQILRFLTEDPDTILVIDAPPILVSSESAVLNVIAGQVVMAVEAGRTTADQIEHALQRLGDRHNVSLVLNASSGVVSYGDDVVVDSGPEADMPPKAEEAKSRLFKAAAIVVVMFTLAAGFIANGYAATAQDTAINIHAAERWSEPVGNRGCR
jgi:receptor protein-tyrosine kinase